MYIPTHFRADDLSAIEKLVREFGFATLVSSSGQQPVATHLPLELHTDADRWTLYGHLARANPQWKNLQSQPQVLAIFMGPHTYVSPSWYTHPNVPTWNYMAAHLSGQVQLLEGDELERSLQQLMARYENAHAAKPQHYEAIPPPMLQQDLRGVVGFKIVVAKIEAAFKLSQNRDNESFTNIIEQLKQLKAYDAERIAHEMQQIKSNRS